MSVSVDPRTVAFDILARHRSAEAASVLAQALECSDEKARQLAAASVVKRRDQKSLLDIVRRIDSLDDEACQEFSRAPERFRLALEEALASSDDQTRNAAVTFIGRTGHFGHFGALLDRLESGDEMIGETIKAPLLEMATRLTMRLRKSDVSIFPALSEKPLRTYRSMILNDLDSRTDRFSRLCHRESVLRLILIPGEPGDAAVRNLFTQRGEACREAAVKLLSEDSQPELLDLLCGFLNHHAPPAAVVDILRTRADLEFVVHLLQWLPIHPTGYLAANLARLEDLPWLRDLPTLLEQLPETLHDRLVAVINCVPISEETRTRMKAQILQQSGAAGREAASDVFKSLPFEEVSQILHDALVDADLEVEAWATRRLRKQQLPDAFHELLKRLDRREVVVRDAARGELVSFDLNFLLKVFSDLPPAQLRQCGQALLKIHPNTIEELISELQHPFRRKQIRAIKAAESLGLLEEVMPQLLEKLRDPEASVRCAVIEAFSRNPSDRTFQAIKRMTADPHRLVRNAAKDAVSKRSRQLESTKTDSRTQASQKFAG